MGGTILVFGSINTDLVMYVGHIPAPGESVCDGRLSTSPGGKGANQAAAAARAGGTVEMFGCVGEDAFGRDRLEDLSGSGVRIGGVKVLAGAATGLAEILVDKNGENTIAVAQGANSMFDSADFEVPRAEAGASFISLYQNEIPLQATEDLIARARKAAHTVIWNFAPASGRPGKDALAAVDYLICNGREIGELAGDPKAPAEKCARELVAVGVKNVIVTKGAEGSILLAKEGLFSQEAFPVKARDTVGAGDCFCGVFAAFLSEGKTAREAMRAASAAAAISCTRKGALDSMPSRSEIESLLAARAAGT
jgi:ribokinase